jgi:hypothetical protein
MIGTIASTSNLDTVVFKCSAPACDGRTFNRWHELKRHYNGAHMAEGVGKTFWFSVVSCERGVAGGRPFPRKDKGDDHVRSVHMLGSTGFQFI